MIIYPRSKTHQLPICSYCTNVLIQTGLRDKDGNFWHPNCYEQHIEGIIHATEESLKIIIGHTQNNNSAANSVARRAINRLTK